MGKRTLLDLLRGKQDVVVNLNISEGRSLVSYPGLTIYLEIPCESLCLKFCVPICKIDLKILITHCFCEGLMKKLISSIWYIILCSINVSKLLKVNYERAT